MSPSIYPAHLKAEAIQQISPEQLTQDALIAGTQPHILISSHIVCQLK